MFMQCMLLCRAVWKIDSPDRKKSIGKETQAVLRARVLGDFECRALFPVHAGIVIAGK